MKKPEVITIKRLVDAGGRAVTDNRRNTCSFLFRPYKTKLVARSNKPKKAGKK